MKKGFTMIELIFVIVILGILAAVAIPRLAATRDDAEATKTASNIKIAMRDFANHYIAKGNFLSDLQQMTNVHLPIEYRGEVCASFEYQTTSSIIMRRNHDKKCDIVWSVGELSRLKDTIFSDGIIIVD